MVSSEEVSSVVVSSLVVSSPVVSSVVVSEDISSVEVSSLVVSSVEVPFWDEVSSDGTTTPLVVISSVWNPGKTNSSFPSSIIIFCSEIKGWLSTSPFISHSNVISNPSILVIVIVISI